MGNPKFIGCDLSGVAFTFSDGADSAFPVANLKSYFASDVAKMAAVSNTHKTIVIDLGSARPCNVIVMDSHNLSILSEMGESITLEYNANDDNVWSDAVATFAAIDSYANQIVWSEFALVTKRYWRIKIATARPVGPLYFGNIFIGNSLQFEHSYDWGYAVANKSYETSKTMALDGRLRSSQAFGGRKMYDLVFSTQSDTTAAAIRAFIETVCGDLRPFYFIDDDGSTVDYVHFADGLEDLRRKVYNQNAVAIKLQSQLTS